MQTFSAIDPKLEIALRSLFGAELYSSRVKAAFSPGPALLAVAMAAGRVRAAMYAVPVDAETADVSAIVAGARHDGDVAMVAALWKTMLEELRAVGMRRVRYEIEQRSPSVDDALKRRGLRRAGKSAVIQGRIVTLLKTCDDRFATLMRRGTSFPVMRLRAPATLSET